MLAEANAALIAAMRNALPDILDEVERGREAEDLAKMAHAEAFSVGWAKGAEAAEAEVARLREALPELLGEINRLREALWPFAAADRAVGDEPGPFRFETGTGYREIVRADLRRASAAFSQPKEASDATG